jgi:hypothetical protein
MINVTGKRRKNIGGKSIVQFNFDGNITGKYCSQHKEDGMIEERPNYL